MEEFIQNVKILVNTLGHKIFEEKREVRSTDKDENDVFYIKAARGAEGKGQPTSDGFVVFKNSKIATKTVPSMTTNFVTLRNDLIQSGAVNDQFEFVDDYLFSSPSTAATMVMGRNANGLAEWKLKNGMSLKEFESDKK